MLDKIKEDFRRHHKKIMLSKQTGNQSFNSQPIKLAKIFFILEVNKQKDPSDNY